MHNVHSATSYLRPVTIMNVWNSLELFIRRQDEAYLDKRERLVRDFINLKLDQGRIKLLLTKDEIECLRSFMGGVVDWREGRSGTFPTLSESFPHIFHVVCVKFYSIHLQFRGELDANLFLPKRLADRVCLTKHRRYNDTGRCVGWLRFVDRSAYLEAVGTRICPKNPFTLDLYCETLHGERSKYPPEGLDSGAIRRDLLSYCIKTFDDKVLLPSTEAGRSHNIQWKWDSSEICATGTEPFRVDQFGSFDCLFLLSPVYKYIQSKLEQLVDPPDRVSFYNSSENDQGFICAPMYSFSHLLRFARLLGIMIERFEECVYIEYRSGFFRLCGNGCVIIIMAELGRETRDKLVWEIQQRFSVDVTVCWRSLLDLTRAMGRLVTVNNSDFVLSGEETALRQWYKFLRVSFGDWLTIKDEYIWRYTCTIRNNTDSGRKVLDTDSRRNYTDSGRNVLDTLSSAIVSMAMHYSWQSEAFKYKFEQKQRAFLRLRTGTASRLGELLGKENELRLSEYRSTLLGWMLGSRSEEAPRLCLDFPVKFGLLELDVHGDDRGFYELLEMLRDELLGSREVTTQSGVSHIVCVRSVDKIVTRFNLERDNKNKNKYRGNIAGFAVFAFHNTIEGFLSIDSKLAPDAPLPSTQDDNLSQLIAWKESEIQLINSTIFSPAYNAIWSGSLLISRETILSDVVPCDVIWTGQVTAVGQRSPKCLEVNLDFNNCYMRNPMMQYIQNRFNSRVRGFGSTDHYPATDAYAQLHGFIADLMLMQEELSNTNPRSPLHGYVPGGIERDLNTALSQLTIYDPDSNPQGILLFPTYLPSHLQRLCEWFENALPELTVDSRMLHFVHIDSEGEFFQLHTETTGCIVIHTGVDAGLERSIQEDMLNRFGLDVYEIWESLQAVTKQVCRIFTLNREDVVFGGDVAGCPIASQAKKRQDQTILPYMETDMTGWYSFIEGKPGKDWFCTRSIDQELVIVATKPMGWKSVMHCGVAYATKQKSSCLCAKKYGWHNLKGKQPEHPQIWHSFPQSGATVFKSLQRKLDWTVVYYAIADLIKARSLTLYQDRLRVDIIRPILRDTQ
jgi:hypothetical protein